MSDDLVDPPLNWESATARIKQLDAQFEELKYKARRLSDDIGDISSELFTLCLDLDEIAALPAVQPDAAAIREAALREASEIAAQEGWPSIMSDAEYEAMTGIEEGSMNCATRIEAAILALIDTGKEVMPSDETRPVPRASDIGPGDQAVAGAAQKGDSHE
jgi:hypothetical protein